MQAFILKMLIEMVLKQASEDAMKSIAEKIIEEIENFVAGTDPKWDDLVVLPLCATARKAYNLSPRKEKKEEGKGGK